MAIEFVKMLNAKGTEAVENKNQLDLFEQMAFWFFNDERFSGNLHKGLFIHGGKGTGKTKAMKVFAEAIRRGFKARIEIIHALELQSLYAKNRDEEIENLKRKKLLIIDDVGTEQVDVKHFGTVVQPFVDMFDARYRRGLHTIITTNLPPFATNPPNGLSIQERYGERVIDRFKECLNDLLLDGESLRK